MPNRKLVGVQYLRAIAALMVVYFHGTLRLPEYTVSLQMRDSTFLDISRLGISGVHVFFVISGFIMMVTTRSSTPGHFLTRRLIRIVPLYWALTTVWIALIILPPHFATNIPVSWGYYARSLLFVHYIVNGIPGPLLAPGWSLNVEMFFYALFTLALFAAFRWRLAIVGGALVIAAIIGTYLTKTTPELWLITRPYVLEFACGMGIAQLLMAQRLRLGRVTCALLVVTGFVALLGGWNDTGNPLLQYVLPATAILLGSVAYEHRFGVAHFRFPTLLGDASYSLYLSHGFALGVAGLVWKHFRLNAAGPAHMAAFMVFAIAACIALALMIYRWLEQPMLALLMRRVEGSTRRAPLDARARPGVSA